MAAGGFSRSVRALGRGTEYGIAPGEYSSSDMTRLRAHDEQRYLYAVNICQSV